MRAAFFLLASAMLLVGCGPGADPALGACATRKPAQMTLGTGQDKFEPLQGSVVIQIGPAGQGGGSYHIWFAMRCQNMGPHVTAQISVVDVATAQTLTPLSLREAIDLEYNPEVHADDVYGIRGFLESSEIDPLMSVDPGMLLGRQVELSVQMDDDCKAHQEATAEVTVRGYHQL